jgi:ABC-type antimicrobial peptide transport system permease subunit
MKDETQGMNRDDKSEGTQGRLASGGKTYSGSEWEVGSLRLRPAVVFSMAFSSLKLRVTRSLLTLLTIATASAFMMYLLTMARQGDSTEQQSWYLMLALSLVVSAAGVLNTMLMAVTQRYREIGTMKCLGALDSFVLLSVLLEAVILGLAGALVGALLGVVISVVLGFAEFGTACFTHLRMGGMTLKVLFVFVSGMALTTFGAAVPAYIASKMPPMDAMRGEK